MTFQFIKYKRFYMEGKFLLWEKLVLALSHMGYKSISNKTVATSGVHRTSTIFSQRTPRLQSLSEI